MRRGVKIIAILTLTIVLAFSIWAWAETNNSNIYSQNNPIVQAVKKVGPAVVRIDTEKKIKVGGAPFPYGGYDEFFRRFFGEDPFLKEFFGGPPAPERERIVAGIGSGFIFDGRGYILTNNHVVDGADNIEVTLNDGRKFKAKLVGADPYTDLAVIKIDGKNLPVAPLGDSSKVQIGEWAIAIGNPLGIQNTVTLGIISALDRTIPRPNGQGVMRHLIQTDAAINPGNSGGPLINIKGEVIGVNTAIIASAQGIGFAVAINTAKSIINDLITEGKVERAYLGVYIQDLTKDIAETMGLNVEKGALITEVVKGSPADKAGLKRGDVIIKVDDTKIDSSGTLQDVIRGKKAGTKVTLTVIRDNKELTIDVTLGKLSTEEVKAKKEKSEAEELGIEVANITPKIKDYFGIEDNEGVVVTKVKPGSIAAFSGIQPGDVIKEINRTPIKNVNDFENALKKIKNGKKLLLLISREGHNYYLVVSR